MKTKRLLSVLLSGTMILTSYIATPALALSDLLINGGFEEDFIGTDDWKFTNKGGWYSNTDDADDRDTSEKYSGEYSLRLKNGNAGQRVTFEKGKTYALSAKIKGEGTVKLGLGDGLKDWPASNFVKQEEFTATENWTDAQLEFSCTNTQDYIICIDSWDNTLNYVDDVIIKEKTNIISSFSAWETETGVDYEAQYSTDKENAVLYTALYDESGALIECKKNISEGSFTAELSEGKIYTVKAFLWNDMEPLDMKEDSFTVGEMSAYMFVHFVGSEQSADEEQIYFSVSRDGKNWTTLNDKNPVLRSDVGEMGVRDPYIMRSPDGEKFYIIATDLSIYNRGGDWDCTNGASDKAGSKNIVVWESDNLTDWSSARLARVAPDNAGCFWAPECVWDENEQAYMVFGACSTSDNDYGAMRIFKTYTVDFEEFTPAEEFMNVWDRNLGVIDTTIVQDDDGKYYRIFKTDRIEMETADSLEGPWTTVNTNVHSIASNVEGPTICKINGSDKWALMVDGLGGSGANAKGYHPIVTDDLSQGQFALSDDIVMPADITIRHGAIMPITSEEYGRLIAKEQW